MEPNTKAIKEENSVVDPRSPLVAVNQYEVAVRILAPIRMATYTQGESKK
jgi:hypothetical protein